MIKKLIETWAPHIHCPGDLDPECLLWAIYGCEKYDKYNKVPRFEPAFAPGGYYYQRDALTRDAYAKWGDDAARSYSNFQILYVTAYALGYQGPPLALDHDSVALQYVVQYLNLRIFHLGAATPVQVADAYNSGSFKDQLVPASYIDKFVGFYEKCKERKCLKVSTKEQDVSITSSPA